MKILLLAARCDQTNILFNYLRDDFKIENVIIEERVKVLIFIKNRIKKLGVLKVIDQLLFIMVMNKVVNYLSRKRLAEIYQEHHLDKKEIPESQISNVQSVNQSSTIALIKSYQPDVILVSGTRIISKKVLNEIDVPFINIHSGITPDYRGVHGAYWAFINQEPETAGVTVHYVDKGVDTGKIIAQSIISVTRADNISTYPILQLNNGLKLLKLHLCNKMAIKDNAPIFSKGKSKQWYHPGFTAYFYCWIFKGLK